MPEAGDGGLLAHREDGEQEAAGEKARDPRCGRGGRSGGVPRRVRAGQRDVLGEGGGRETATRWRDRSSSHRAIRATPAARSAGAPAAGSSMRAAWP